MSSGLDLAVTGALLLKLSVSDLSKKRNLFSSSSSSVCSVLGGLVVLLSFCCSQQSLNLGCPDFSMRLRPIRTCSGVECFGSFHIKRFFYLFIFIRGPLT